MPDKSCLRLCCSHFAQGADYLSLQGSLREIPAYEGLLGFIIAAKHCKNLSLSELYDAFDFDNDGFISLDDFIWSFSSLGFRDLERDDLDTVLSLFRFLDPCRVGYITQEFWVSKLHPIALILIPCAEYEIDPICQCFNSSQCSCMMKSAPIAEGPAGTAYPSPVRIDIVARPPDLIDIHVQGADFANEDQPQKFKENSDDYDSCADSSETYGHFLNFNKYDRFKLERIPERDEAGRLSFEETSHSEYRSVGTSPRLPKDPSSRNANEISAPANEISALDYVGWVQSTGITGSSCDSGDKYQSPAIEFFPPPLESHSFMNASIQTAVTDSLDTTAVQTGVSSESSEPNSFYDSDSREFEPAEVLDWTLQHVEEQEDGANRPAQASTIKREDSGSSRIPPQKQSDSATNTEAMAVTCCDSRAGMEAQEMRHDWAEGGAPERVGSAPAHPTSVPSSGVSSESTQIQGRVPTNCTESLATQSSRMNEARQQATEIIGGNVSGKGDESAHRNGSALEDKIVLLPQASRSTCLGQCSSSEFHGAQALAGSKRTASARIRLGDAKLTRIAAQNSGGEAGEASPHGSESAEVRLEVKISLHVQAGVHENSRTSLELQRQVQPTIIATSQARSASPENAMAQSETDLGENSTQIEGQEAVDSEQDPYVSGAQAVARTIPQEMTHRSIGSTRCEDEMFILSEQVAHSPRKDAKVTSNMHRQESLHIHSVLEEDSNCDSAIIPQIKYPDPNSFTAIDHLDAQPGLVSVRPINAKGITEENTQEIDGTIGKFQLCPHTSFEVLGESVASNSDTIVVLKGARKYIQEALAHVHVCNLDSINSPNSQQMNDTIRLNSKRGETSNIESNIFDVENSDCKSDHEAKEKQQFSDPACDFLNQPERHLGVLNLPCVTECNHGLGSMENDNMLPAQKIYDAMNSGAMFQNINKSSNALKFERSNELMYEVSMTPGQGEPETAQPENISTGNVTKLGWKSVDANERLQAITSSCKLTTLSNHVLNGEIYGLSIQDSRRSDSSPLESSLNEAVMNSCCRSEENARVSEVSSNPFFKIGSGLESLKSQRDPQSFLSLVANENPANEISIIPRQTSELKFDSPAWDVKRISPGISPTLSLENSEKIHPSHNQGCLESPRTSNCLQTSNPNHQEALIHKMAIPTLSMDCAVQDRMSTESSRDNSCSGEERRDLMHSNSLEPFGGQLGSDLLPHIHSSPTRKRRQFLVPLPDVTVKCNPDSTEVAIFPEWRISAFAKNSQLQSSLAGVHNDDMSKDSWQSEIRRRHQLLQHEKDEVPNLNKNDIKKKLNLDLVNRNLRNKLKLDLSKLELQKEPEVVETKKSVKLQQPVLPRRLQKIRKRCKGEEATKLSIFISVGKLEYVKAYENEKRIFSKLPDIRNYL